MKKLLVFILLLSSLLAAPSVAKTPDHYKLVGWTDKSSLDCNLSDEAPSDHICKTTDDGKSFVYVWSSTDFRDINLILDIPVGTKVALFGDTLHDVDGIDKVKIAIVFPDASCQLKLNKSNDLNVGKTADTGKNIYNPLATVVCP